MSPFGGEAGEKMDVPNCFPAVICNYAFLFYFFAFFFLFQSESREWSQDLCVRGCLCVIDIMKLEEKL